MSDIWEQGKKLREEYDSGWDEVPGHPKEDWRNEVYADDTWLGYWEWVANRIENQELEDNDDD